MKGMIKHLKGTFLPGIFIVIPFGITIFILKFLFNFADGILGSPLDNLMELTGRNIGHIPGIGMITAFLVIYLTGLFATNVIGKRMLIMGDNFLSRIPLVKSIYSSSKQLTKVFSEGGASYRRAVFVEWPRPGVRAIGFVTAGVVHDGTKYLIVYVPTMPNPTSGFALWFQEQEVYESGMTVEDAVKFVVSGGVVLPEQYGESQSVSTHNQA